MGKIAQIVIVDDHEIFRKGFAMVIDTLNNVELAGEASNGQEFLELIEKIEADIVFMDIKMPIMNGIEATQKALIKRPDLKILALSMFGEEQYLHSMIKAGSVGFLLKNVKRDELDIAIRLVLDGKNYYSEELLHFFTKRFLENKSHHNLTKRELEVLQLVAEGLTNQEIADKLFISLRTVEGHKTSLVLKTGSKNIVNALVHAIKNHLIEI
jgi:DNA-binding NarL/FixJ family response regulator